ncbi:hypothetical protein F2Q69_00013745 [Brassica cretica]|uniref:Uncharacterized protein n=1 Tax=Brassica cretica TaxID=69181 RepID=A0A8S9QL12_BRACR|nr:hypothetical protein F2Q69_00013745 [Brassica cretica]
MTAVVVTSVTAAVVILAFSTAPSLSVFLVLGIRFRFTIIFTDCFPSDLRLIYSVARDVVGEKEWEVEAEARLFNSPDIDSARVVAAAAAAAKKVKAYANQPNRSPAFTVAANLPVPWQVKGEPPPPPR